MRIITTIILSILLTPFFCHAEERCETKSISASFSLEKWSTSSIPSDTTITDTLRQADIRFDEPRFSFGNISQSKGPKQTHSFWFENTGKAPLFILEAISGCGGSRGEREGGCDLRRHRPPTGTFREVGDRIYQLRAFLHPPFH